MTLKDRLMELQDLKYADFQRKLMPTVPAEKVIGVRTPQLRNLAKELKGSEEAEAFLEELPHEFFDENQLHAFLIGEEKDFDKCIREVERFLPFVDNWATCDQLSPKVFRKHRTEQLGYIRRWLDSDHTYTVRFAEGMLMEHFLDEDFAPEYPEMVAAVRSEEYYINMMTAWSFATALAKQWDAVLPYIEGRRLDMWTHNKAIQKSVESRRITPEQKEYLKTLKIKKERAAARG